jgi:outer membrane biosynthesis protein TonB
VSGDVFPARAAGAAGNRRRAVLLSVGIHLLVLAAGWRIAWFPLRDVPVAGGPYVVALVEDSPAPPAASPAPAEPAPAAPAPASPAPAAPGPEAPASAAAVEAAPAAVAADVPAAPGAGTLSGGPGESAARAAPERYVPPRLLAGALPLAPEDREAGTPAEITARLLVGADGYVSRVEPATAALSPRVADAVRRSALAMRFAPARRGDTAVPAWFTMTFTYRR